MKRTKRMMMALVVAIMLAFGVGGAGLASAHMDHRLEKACPHADNRPPFCP
jgi:hypothetical protein